MWWCKGIRRRGLGRAHPPKLVGSPISRQPRRQGHCASDEQTFLDGPHHAERADDP